MLSEGYELLYSLRKCNIDFPVTHKFITKVPKGRGYIVYLNNSGEPADVEFKEDLSNLWEIKFNKNNYFPFYKLKKPICFSSKNKKELIKNELVQYVKNFKIEIPNALEKNFNTFKKEFISTYLSNIKNNDGIEPVQELIDRFLKVNLENLIEKLKNILLQKFENKDITQEVFSKITVGQWSKKNEYSSNVIFLYFDINNFDDYSNRVSRIICSESFSKIMTDLDEELNKDSGIVGTCSLSGKNVFLETDGFPTVKLPHYDTLLLSMNVNYLPSLNRYQLGENIFPVGKKIVNEIRSSIQFITQKERELKTWKSIPTNKINSSSGNTNIQNDLLICYIKDKPDFEGDLALVTSWEGNSAYRETFFEDACSSLLNDIQKSKVQHESIIRLFAIRKVDKGNSQISLNESYTISNLIKASDEWITGSNNTIDFKIDIPIKDKNSKNISRKTVLKLIPYPSEMLSILQRKWKYSINYLKHVTNDDNFSYTASLTNISEIYKIFYDDPTIGKEPILKKILRELLVNNTNLLLNISHSLTRRKKHENSNIDETMNIPDFHRLHTLLVISSIGILLYKLNIQKETYMKSAPYLVGRYFYWADELHKRYCDAERNKEYPPQLIGNSCMRIASQSITKALAFLEERILHYQAWANTDKENRAGFVPNEIGKVSEELSNLEIPNTIKEIEKAQLLLGYMTRIYK